MLEDCRIFFFLYELKYQMTYELQWSCAFIIGCDLCQHSTKWNVFKAFVTIVTIIQIKQFYPWFQVKAHLFVFWRFKSIIFHVCFLCCLKFICYENYWNLNINFPCFFWLVSLLLFSWMRLSWNFMNTAKRNDPSTKMRMS